MFGKTINKIVVALGILALALAFLGVNFVPRIFASSPKESVGSSAVQARANYVNEIYQRSMVTRLSGSASDFYQRHASELSKLRGDGGSDFYQRHVSELTKLSVVGGSDYFQRHSAELTKIIGTGASEFLNHHPYDTTQSLNSDGSDFLNHHPYDVSK